MGGSHNGGFSSNYRQSIFQPIFEQQQREGLHGSRSPSRHNQVINETMQQPNPGGLAMSTVCTAATLAGPSKGQQLQQHSLRPFLTSNASSLSTTACCSSNHSSTVLPSTVSVGTGRSVSTSRATVDSPASISHVAVGLSDLPAALRSSMSSIVIGDSSSMQQQPQPQPPQSDMSTPDTSSGTTTTHQSLSASSYGLLPLYSSDRPTTLTSALRNHEDLSLSSSGFPEATPSSVSSRTQKPSLSLQGLFVRIDNTNCFACGQSSWLFVT